jgi:putative ABC transport system ATP-binding protein
MSAHIEIDGLTKHYVVGQGRVLALDGVSLSIAAGTMVAIMGPSGSGKSTLMNLLGLLDTPTSGSYRIEGAEVAGLSDAARSRERRERIGFIFQSFNLLPRKSAIENVAIPLMYAGVGRAERQERARMILEQVGLGDRMRHRPTELSGGQQQRVAIARALINQPALILADEPTGNLDSRTGREVLGLLRQLHAAGRTIVVVTHDRAVAEIAQRIVTLVDGRIVSDEQVDGADAGPAAGHGATAVATWGSASHPLPAGPPAATTTGAASGRAASGLAASDPAAS